MSLYIFGDICVCIYIYLYMYVCIGFPGGIAVKNPSANAGDTVYAGLIPGSGRSHGEGHGNSGILV